ncbi:MAG: Na/Pi cotransporter family protein [Eubacteriales bacterium]|nr:Na/Pi cotransporter family protein [Eubacteriales bacterium]
MGISEIFSLVTGLALFLYGMSAMGDALKRVAGSKLETILWKLSSNPIKGVALGAGVTAVIQSSSATSCMVVGFVNSGIMTIAQAIGIIMGANIGTTATGWILSLSSVDGGSGPWWTELLTTAFICGIFALIGTLLKMFSKKDALKHTGDIMLGFAVLMSGMKLMSGAMGGLSDSEVFRNMMTSFSNPFLGVLAGAVITAILQSASASIGILQSLAIGTVVVVNGVEASAITNEIALYLIIGMCIGASVPVLLSAIGATTNGKRASIIYLLFNTFGAIVLTPVCWGLDTIFHFPYMDAPADAISIALINTVFNFATTLILMPLVKQFDRLVCFIIKDKESDQSANILDRLEERFLTHPAIAIEQSREVIFSMAEKAERNLQRSIKLVSDYSDEEYQIAQEKEETIDKYEDKLGTYLVKVTGLNLDNKQSREVSKFLHTIGDFERIGDHAVNISHVAKEIHEKQLVFSHEANHELQVLADAVQEIVALSVKAFESGSTADAIKVEPLEETIDMLCDELKLRHIQRVQNGNCTLNQGFVFSDLITNYERIADHCSNIAVALIELDNDEYDVHKYLSYLKEHKSPFFIRSFDEYKNKYSL